MRAFREREREREREACVLACVFPQFIVPSFARMRHEVQGCCCSFKGLTFIYFYGEGLIRERMKGITK